MKTKIQKTTVIFAMFIFIILAFNSCEGDNPDDDFEVYWKKIPDVAQYGGADWKNEIQRVQGITLEKAMEIGESDSDVTFFFYVKNGPVSFGDKGVFLTGEAVFFSGGYWWGSAVGIADSYVKNGPTDYSISLNEEFNIELKANRTTGYKWHWKNSKSVQIVDSIGFTYVVDNPNLSGSGGKEIWTFKGVKKGLDYIRMEYYQPWTPNSIVDSKTIYVKVK